MGPNTRRGTVPFPLPILRRHRRHLLIAAAILLGVVGMIVGALPLLEGHRADGRTLLSILILAGALAIYALAEHLDARRKNRS